MFSLLVFLAGPAWACGGLFCNTVDPVDQAGEVVVFAVDGDSVEMHVQVTYEGGADDFAWVLPVEGVPDLFLSHSKFFTTLPQLTEPVYDWWTDSGDCRMEGIPNPRDLDGGVSETTFGQGVDVLQNQRVGPYETVTLGASSGSDLVAWLEVNGFAVPPEFDAMAEPYLGEGMNFLALKLAKNADVGDLSPLGLRYQGTTPAIPIRLTRAAAVPDMPVTVFLLGDARAVPVNYLHVRANPLRSGTTPRDQLVLGAVDEAGGHAFATDAAMATGGLVTQIPPAVDLSGLEAYADPAEWLTALIDRRIGGTPEVLEVLSEHIPVPAGFPGEVTDFYNCPGCYVEWYAQITDFDPVAATDDLIENEIAPRERIVDLLEQHAVLTRLSTALSPEEMTVDPMFAFNPDLPLVDRERIGRRVLTCELFGEWDASKVEQQFVFPGLLPVWLPSESDLGSTTTEAALADVIPYDALVVEQLSDSGPPEILVDRRGDLGSHAFPSQIGDPEGCGCRTATGPGGLVGWLALAGLALRRRRP